jgi:translation initiation factor 2B subunit (eIF-2B alpha/beta/delta family)
MIIVKDIQDAVTMERQIRSIIKRARVFNHSKKDVLEELDMIVSDLKQNIDREENAVLSEVLGGK